MRRSRHCLDSADNSTGQAFNQLVFFGVGKPFQNAGPGQKPHQLEKLRKKRRRIMRIQVIPDKNDFGFGIRRCQGFSHTRRNFSGFAFRHFHDATSDKDSRAEQ